MKQRYLIQTLLLCAVFSNSLLAQPAISELPSGRISDKPYVGVTVKIGIANVARPIINLFKRKNSASLSLPPNYKAYSKPVETVQLGQPLMYNLGGDNTIPPPKGNNGASESNLQWNAECGCWIPQEIDDDPPVVIGRNDDPPPPPPPANPDPSGPRGGDAPPGDGGGGGDQPAPSPEPDAKPDPLKNAKLSSKSDACRTFRQMWERQRDVKKEQAALLTDKGIIWMNDADNGIDFSNNPPDDASKVIDGQRYVYINGQPYKVIAQVHTHPTDAMYPQGDNKPSDRDEDFAKRWNIPVYIIADEGIWQCRASGGYSIINYNYTTAFDCGTSNNLFNYN